jgi:hypothetical protein
MRLASIASTFAASAPSRLSTLTATCSPSRRRDVELEVGGKNRKAPRPLCAVDANAQLVAINKKGQKLFTSCEIAPNFAGTNRAYLVGLAVTDSPASLGTEMLRSQRPRATTTRSRKPQARRATCSPRPTLRARARARAPKRLRRRRHRGRARPDRDFRGVVARFTGTPAPEAPAAAPEAPAAPRRRGPRRRPRRLRRGARGPCCACCAGE